MKAPKCAMILCAAFLCCVVLLECWASQISAADFAPNMQIDKILIEYLTEEKLYLQFCTFGTFALTNLSPHQCNKDVLK